MGFWPPGLCDGAQLDFHARARDDGWMKNGWMKKWVDNDDGWDFGRLSSMTGPGLIFTPGPEMMDG